MNITVFLITFYIFLNTISYGIYELKNKNIFGGSAVILLSIAMIVSVNIFTIRFN